MKNKFIYFFIAVTLLCTRSYCQDITSSKPGRGHHVIVDNSTPDQRIPVTIENTKSIPVSLENATPINVTITNPPTPVYKPYSISMPFAKSDMDYSWKCHNAQTKYIGMKFEPLEGETIVIESVLMGELVDNYRIIIRDKDDDDCPESREYHGEAILPAATTSQGQKIVIPYKKKCLLVVSTAIFVDNHSKQFVKNSARLHVSGTLYKEVK